ncbi:ERG3 Sterol desaturase [Pyrenophora tritici-repentis]|nr:ERG3 Sterol desaturase [Pyrenophora tritici-repentis]PZD24545.1 ERG3, Sterol desaturase [Pyrenophora tritici-repentis]
MPAMMTVSNPLRGSATAPSIPMPAPVPAFDRLPVELLERILDPYRDDTETLFALRRTCRLFRLLTNKPLALRLGNDLRNLRVFMTEEGLKTLLGLICIPEWRCYVRLVELVDPGVEDLRQDRQDKDQWFGYNILPQLETIVKRIRPAQRAFYAEQAPGLMKEMFRLFKTMDALSEIRFGVRGDDYDQILGLKYMVREIGFDRTSLVLAPMHVTKNITSRDFGGRCLGGHASWLYKILSDSNYDKRIITVDLYDRMHPGIWSLSQVWTALDHPSIQELRIFYRIPVHPANIIVPSWVVDLELTPGTFTLASEMSIEILTLVGSRGEQNYAANAETFALLANTTFPNLRRLELRGYAVSGDQFINVLESIKTTVQCMCLVSIHLISGSWSSVFKALSKCTELDRLGFRQLTGRGSSQGGPPICCKFDSVLREKWDVFCNRTGDKMMTEFLDLMGEYVLIAADYKGDSYVENNATSILTPMAQDTYWGSFEEISKYNVQLNYLERMWMAWYAWMGNDVLATGIMSFVIHEALYYGRSLPWIIIDCIPFFNRYKIQQHKVPTAWEQTQCALLVLLSHFTVELPQIWLFHPMCQYFGLSTSVPFPSVYKMAYQIAIFLVLEDTWHYWSHRAMHASSFLYKNIHKIHHQYSAPFGLAAEYASPIEVMILGFGTVGVPIVFCAITKDLHILTMYVWIACRVFQAIDAHSGYEFPWSLHHFLPFWAGAEHHDVHHEKFIGNYASSFRWWDFVLDTEAGAEASKRRRERKLAKARKVQ